MDAYWFKSDLFRIEPGEDQATSPGRYGIQLARWLGRRLEDLGYRVAEEFTENWGRCLLLADTSDRLWVGCANFNDTDPVRGGETVWYCFAIVEPSWRRRVFHKAAIHAAWARLHADLGHLLAAERAVTLVPEPATEPC